MELVANSRSFTKVKNIARVQQKVRRNSRNNLCGAQSPLIMTKISYGDFVDFTRKKSL